MRPAEKEDSARSGRRWLTAAAAAPAAHRGVRSADVVQPRLVLCPNCSLSPGCVGRRARGAEEEGRSGAAGGREEEGRHQARARQEGGGGEETRRENGNETGTHTRTSMHAPRRAALLHPPPSALSPLQLAVFRIHAGWLGCCVFVMRAESVDDGWGSTVSQIHPAHSSAAQSNHCRRDVAASTALVRRCAC